jgi:hypothetical protein
MESGISLLERWYGDRCNGDWEHQWGVKLESQDNPGWRLTIDLNETRAAGRTLERTRIQRSEDDWINYKAEKNQFLVACGPLNLSESIKIFLDWFES